MLCICTPTWETGWGRKCWCTKWDYAVTKNCLSSERTSFIIYIKTKRPWYFSRCIFCCVLFNYLLYMLIDSFAFFLLPQMHLLRGSSRTESTKTLLRSLSKFEVENSFFVMSFINIVLGVFWNMIPAHNF